MKNDKMQIRISEAEKEELNELAERLDVPASQIVRDGIRARIAELKGSEAAEIEVAVHPQQA